METDFKDKVMDMVTPDKPKSWWNTGSVLQNGFLVCFLLVTPLSIAFIKSEQNAAIAAFAVTTINLVFGSIVGFYFSKVNHLPDKKQEEKPLNN